MSATAERPLSIPLLERSGLQEVKDRVRDIPVCLVIPDSGFLLDSRVFDFAGAEKVAAELEANGNPISVLDLSKYGNSDEIVTQYVSQTQKVVFGITATTPHLPEAVKIRNAIKKVKPDATIVLGGPHGTLTHAAMVEDNKAGRLGRGTRAFEQLPRYFDKLVIGDGEMAIFYAMDPANKGQIIDASTLKADLFIKRGELDKFRWPARHLIDHNSYKFYINDDGKPYRAFSVIGQLGCPFECGFCGGRDAQSFRMTRTRSIENIVAEIEHTIRVSEDYSEPFRGVMFYDDELNVSPSNLENLCTGLISLQKKLGVEMRFRGFVKAELFTKEQARLMYAAGFRVLLSGVESGSDKTLKAMKKHTSKAINSRCAELAHNAGLSFKALMSIGHPGESSETVKESIDWVLENLKEGDDVDFTVITQYPGSPYYDRSVLVREENAWLYETKVGGRVERLWSNEIDFAEQAEFYKGIPGNYVAYLWTDHLSPKDLVRERDNAERITRSQLKLPEFATVAALQFEHSMGQSLPSNILRKTGVLYQA